MPETFGPGAAGATAARVQADEAAGRRAGVRHVSSLGELEVGSHRGTTNPRALAVRWLTGGLALAVATAGCFWLGTSLGTAGFLFLIIIVQLALFDGLATPLIFSAIAVAVLAFFFAPPVLTLHLPSQMDAWRLAAFFGTSVVILVLVGRLSAAAALERRQSSLLDLTHDAVIVCDMDDAILYWNRGAEELYGWTREEAIGRRPYELLKTQFPAPLDELNETLTRTGEWAGELTHKKRNGSTIYVSSRWALQRDAAGKPIGMLETNRDITEAKLAELERARAEEALRRSQAAYLSEAQRLSVTGSFGWNVATGELFWSEQTFRIFGFDPQVKPSIELVVQRTHPDDLAPVHRVIDHATTSRQPFDFEHRLLMPDGAVKTVHVVARPLAEAGDRAQFIGAVMDVTARTEAYAALQQSERRYRMLFDHVPVAILQVSIPADVRKRLESRPDLEAYLGQHPENLRLVMGAQRIEAANQRAIEMFGARDASELLNASGAWLWRERPDTFRRSLVSGLRDHAIFEEETKVATLDGRVIDVLFSRFEPPPGLGFMLYTFRDVTEQNRAHETLQRIQAEYAHAARISMLGELTASVAHEVNQPLAAVIAAGAASLRWLERPEPNIEEACITVRRMVKDAHRAGEIIARIRAMAAGRAPQHTDLTLHDVIDDALLFLRHELQAKRVALALDLAPAPPRVLGDRTQLQQVLVNLVLNAIQAMSQAEGTRRVLAIRTVCDGERLTCTIDDSGPGIAPEHLDRLFESFFTTKTAGMGIGLAISRSIIEQHGGELHADNGSDLGGARFWFNLPVAPAPD